MESQVLSQCGASLNGDPKVLSFVSISTPDLTHQLINYTIHNKTLYNNNYYSNFNHFSITIFKNSYSKYNSVYKKYVLLKLFSELSSEKNKDLFHSYINLS